VGLYVGDGTGIEAMGTINGVTTSKVTAGKWTYWGELTGVDYENSEFIIQNSELKETGTGSGNKGTGSAGTVLQRSAERSPGEPSPTVQGGSSQYRVIISGLDLTQATALQRNYPGSVIEKEMG
jgi:hypothetical protein